MNKSLFKRILCTIIFALVVYYFALPPINLHAFSFYMYIIFVMLFFIAMSIPDVVINLFKNKRMIREVKLENKVIKYMFFSVIGIIPVIILINIVFSPLFNSKAYYERIKINEEGNFTKDIKEVDFSHIPLLDKASSQKLGDRTMGEMTTLVSQFYVSELYTQINYNDEIVRVTPLEYSGFIKYLTNRKDGIPAYITVNSVNGKSELKKLDKGMRYAPSAHFFENLQRKLRLSYPTKVFGTENFEVDNEGNPYWIIPTIKYTSVGMRRDVDGVVIFNPVDGTSKWYKVEDVPTWVDHVYNSDLILEQVNDWGAYKHGFLNTIFGQKEVVATTEGYNYTILNDDVYLYTGITSVVADESNIGFILTNMRTKETTFYEISGAEEFSAMASAEGQVQQMSYNASFPLLINFNGKPTYFLSLKDAAGLVKMYAFVDVKDYQKVVVTDSSKGIDVAASNYLGDEKVIDKEKLVTKEITISSIKDVVIDSNTYYYIVDTNNNKYIVSIKKNREFIPFLSNGDKVTITYEDSKKVHDIIEIK
ncbi:MAG: CvpA family protein [Bacilli bacterium]|nr:CvpA family protein [Bacilli bacterium]